MNAIAQMARVMTGQPVKLRVRRQTLIEQRIARAEAIRQGELVRIAAYTKYLTQRGFVVMAARDFEQIATPHKPMREGAL